VLIFPLGLLAQQIDVIPKPSSIKKLPGGFQLNVKTCILGNSEYATMINFYLKELYGFTLPVKEKIEKNENVIRFSSKHRESRFPNEGYEMFIRKNGIEIASKSGAGAFYGIQTLLQLLPANLNVPYLIPLVEIVDSPRFA